MFIGAGEEALTLISRICTNLHPVNELGFRKGNEGNEVDWTCKSECRTRKPEAKQCAQKRTGVVYKRKRRQRRGPGFAKSEWRTTKSEGDPNTEGGEGFLPPGYATI